MFVCCWVCFCLFVFVWLIVWMFVCFVSLYMIKPFCLICMSTDSRGHQFRLIWSKFTVSHDRSMYRIIAYIWALTKGPLLFRVYRGWNATQLSWDNFISHCKDPYSTASIITEVGGHNLSRPFTRPCIMGAPCHSIYRSILRPACMVKKFLHLPIMLTS